MTTAFLLGFRSVPLWFARREKTAHRSEPQDEKETIFWGVSPGKKKREKETKGRSRERAKKMYIIDAKPLRREAKDEEHFEQNSK